ncbi:MAG: hypothetical protein U0704_10420 [Candidatus Eisenbacteria bacterium]
MRRWSLLPLLLLTLQIPAAPAHAQPAPAAVRDTVGFLPHWLDGAAEAGVGWLAGPSVVHRRYTAGLDAALELQAKLAPALRLGVRGEYHDLPSRNSGFMVTSGGLYNNWDSWGDGRAWMFMGEGSVRTWRALWLDAAAGIGHFSSGYGDAVFVDGVTGEDFTPPGTTGWGAAFGAGARYEFQPNKRDRLFAVATWRRLERDDVVLQFGALRMGYRFR